MIEGDDIWLALVFVLLLVAFGACGDGPIPEAGQGCETLEDCPAGMQCLLQLSPWHPIAGGICTYDCELAKSDAEDTCGPNTVCVKWQGLGQSKCWPRCESQECRTDEGWHCEPIQNNNQLCIFPL